MTTPAPAPSAPPTPAFVRPVLGLLAGLGITVVTVVIGTLAATFAMLGGATDAKSFVVTPGYLAANVAISIAGSIAGGFTTARITAGRSSFTLLVLALVLFMSGMGPVLRGGPAPPNQPSWYPIAMAIVGPLGVLIGGYLERRPRRNARVAA